MKFLLTLCLLLTTTTCYAAPKIVVSIAPIHALVSSITQGVSTPELLLNEGASPHSSSLRPSQARALAETDLLIWIGPELESFLESSVTRLVRPTAEMELLKLKNLKLLPQRHGGFWEEDDHADESKHHHGSINPHIWLSPDNANQIAVSICKRLIEIDPDNETIYRKNLASLKQRIDNLQLDLNNRLSLIKNRPYLVFHDAYPYLEEAFSLNAIGSIRISAARAPGARRLQQIRTKITESSAVCLFSEPQFSPALAESLTRGTSLKLGILDPLGTLNSQSEDGWFILMRNLAKNLENCLSEEPQ